MDQPHKITFTYFNVEIFATNLIFIGHEHNFIQKRFLKKNKGSSIGSIINNDIFCKIDIGSRLLIPAKENSVFQLYYNLYPSSSPSFISPNELNVINNLPSNILLNHENIFIQCSFLVKGKGLTISF
ncbi:hypothetical protein ACTFIZ_000820 [Dictyostelium cf. discoideum]